MVDLERFALELGDPDDPEVVCGGFGTPSQVWALGIALHLLPVARTRYDVLALTDEPVPDGE